MISLVVCTQYICAVLEEITVKKLLAQVSKSSYNKQHDRFLPEHMEETVVLFMEYVLSFQTH